MAKFETIKVNFPPLSEATPEGIVAIGGEVSFPYLWEAYQRGIFPWPINEEYLLAWFSPDPRGVLYLDQFHLPKSFKKKLTSLSDQYTVKMNQDFDQVIKCCQQVNRKNQPGTWITDEIVDGYIDFFNRGYAYCVSVYEEEELVGGLYGVRINNFISGESMFHKKDNTSKLALYFLVNWLCEHEPAIEFIDTQMVTPLLALFGAEEIPRVEFIDLIKDVI